MNKNKIYNYIDDNLDTHIQNIQSWVKQKSVSWDNLGMDDASKMVFESFKKLGCKEVEYIEAIDSAVVIPYLVAAIKDLEARIKTLEG